MLRSVLIVDDIPVNRKLIKGILVNKIDNIDFLEAENGKDALELITKENVSVVILDIMMPIMDGIETLAEIKNNPLTDNIPVIMCSAVDDIESMKKALELGALDYFTKPLTLEALRITLPLKVKNAIEYYDTRKELIKYQNHIKEELHFAEKLQKALISEYKDFDKAEIWARYSPCEEVGGDILCTKQINGRLWFIIADICGHGFSAAMQSTMLSVLFTARVEFCDSPGELLKVINNTLFEVFGGDKFNLISAFTGCLSENELWYSNAGHPYPLVYRSEKKQMEFLEEDGFLLGIFQDAEYNSKCIEFEKGDSLLLYTDGIYDSIKNRNVAGWNSIFDYCNEFKESLELDKGKFLDDIISFYKEKALKKFIDDVALMIIENK